jgi:hypothetical protein
MRCPLRFRGFVRIALFLSLAALPLAGCSSGDTAEAGAVGTSASDPLVVTFSQMYMTIENRSGVPIVDGELQIVPRGVTPPFRTRLPRIESGQKRELLFNQFYSRDGTPFRRGGTRTRNLRITATDVSGKKFEQEVPFD